MTDFWPLEEDDPDFFSMRDEDWDAYRRRQMRESGDYVEPAENGPQKPLGPPKGLHPHAPPAIERERSSAALSEAEEVWDGEFSHCCDKCSETAAWWVELHWPHFCGHPSMDDGLLHQLVCHTHLAVYEARADRMVREANPPWWMRLFRTVKPDCSSCGKPIQTRGDIICVVRGL